MTGSEKPAGVGTSVKLAAYVATWLVALFAANPSCEYWSLAYLFPLGLAAFVNLRLGNDGGWGVLGFCYAIYVVHAVFYFRSKTIRSTVFLFAVLVILLVCNVSGCRAQLPHH
ncbi:MAG TPA: hypothetical protein VGM62_06765 [Chthoniobacterales bacterium]|jgi:hypothetical protein